MLFSSTFFLFYFFPVFFTVYYLLPKAAKNYFISFASLVFYAWGAPAFVIQLVILIIFNFIVSLGMDGIRKKGGSPKPLLVVAIVVNVGVLFFYKYFNFCIENLNSLLFHFNHHGIDPMNIILPIGISFFTFHQLSYVIDVYRNSKPPLRNIADYGVYILLFPQLIAGPIIRFHEIADQISGRNKAFIPEHVFAGFLRFTIGLCKKVMIANVLGAEADRIFHLPPDQMNSSLAWIGALTYTFQIYFDFSGYSDMAIGLGKMMGFTFPENFDHPYIATSITDFWRRWHISLSRWMRDYLYIPLGGNKVSGFRLYINLWIVFLISGLWHGAEWTFILWGAYHGFFLAAERLFLLKLEEKIPTLIRVLFSFLIVVLGWVLFRADSLANAKMIWTGMFNFHFVRYEFTTHLALVSLIAVVISFGGLIKLMLRIEQFLFSIETGVVRMFIFSVFILFFISICAGEITSTGFNPFIYFRF